jgi:phosphoserine phosphatase
MSGEHAPSSLVATVIAGSPAGLDMGAIACARSVLPAANAPIWLAAGIAADIPFSAPASESRAIAGKVAAALTGGCADVVVQPALGRRKKLLLTDMDSTMIGEECIDELADYVGVKPQVAAITERAMRGEIDFEPALRARVALLKGLPAALVDDVIKHRIHLTTGARALVSTMRRDGAYTCLVTGGFTLFTQQIGAMLGFDESRANKLMVDTEGRLTGEVREPIFGRDAKLATLVELRRRFNLRPEETLVAGDGANDIAMIEAAGLGVAYYAKPKVAAAAAASINHADLTALLYAQGYRLHEFAAEPA